MADEFDDLKRLNQRLRVNKVDQAIDLWERARELLREDKGAAELQMLAFDLTLAQMTNTELDEVTEWLRDRVRWEMAKLPLER